MRSYVISLALLLTACEKQAALPEKPPSAALQPVTAAPAAAPQAAPTDPNAAMAQLVQPPVPTEPARAGGLTWNAPEPFLRRAPKSSMRVAEYGLKGSPQSELGVFYFGADQGGTVEANMTRWIGQFSQADGSETKAQRSEREVKGVHVSLVEATGIFGGGMAMPGAPVPATQPDSMLLGAIAKGPDGSVFFKFTGPRAALEEARSAFNGLIESIVVAK